MDLPVEPRPWDTSDSNLTAAVAAADGHVTIGLKAPGSARVHGAGVDRGTRAAISAADIADGVRELEARGVEFIYFLDAIGAVKVRIEPELAPALRDLPFVDYLEPNQTFHLQAMRMPRDAVASVTSPQITPWGIQVVRAPEAWTRTTGSGARMLIIDTGTSAHPDLPILSCLDSGACGDSYAAYWHGTHVAGIALARSNTIGVVGVAKGLLAANAFQADVCHSSPNWCFSSEIASALNGAVSQNVDVISMSLGGPYDSGIANAIAAAWADDIVLVAAAGNNNGNHVDYPAGHTNVIGVSGVRPDSTFANFSPCTDGAGNPGSSNYGSHVDVAAPFWALSTIGGNAYGDETNGYCGTSMATPHVAGVVALMRSRFPGETNGWTVARLLDRTHDLGTPGRDDFYGEGLVDAYEAIRQLQAPISGPGQVDVKGTYQWSTTPIEGYAPFSYQWSVSWPNGQARSLGSLQSASFGAAAGDDFTIKVVVQGAGNESTTSTLLVRNCIGEDCPPEN